LNHLLFPGPTKDFQQVRASYGDVSLLDTESYLYGMTPSAADERGMRTVMFTLNGQLRPIQVRDRSVEVDQVAAEKAEPGTPGQIAAPFAGAVTPVVQEGRKVQAGQTVATIEAMKMEASITTPVGGTVRRLAIGAVQQLEGGDLVMVIA